MENPEKEIERVLAGLRDAEAPVGMERRILDAVRDRAVMGTGHGLLRWRPIWLELRRVGWGVGAVAVFAAVAMLYTMRRAPDTAQRHLVAVMPAASSKVAVEKAQPVRLAGTERREVRERPVSGPAQKARVVDDGDSVALSEMRAASQPAPPLALTEQEKLLLRIAHKGDPVELAMLDPVQRDARNAEEGAEFRRFFGQATSGQPAAEVSKTEQPPAEPTTTEPTKTEQSPKEQKTREPSTTGDNK
jgi:hypothetical protein